MIMSKKVTISMRKGGKKKGGRCQGSLAHNNREFLSKNINKKLMQICLQKIWLSLRKI
jgi:hypothetical protein